MRLHSVVVIGLAHTYRKEIASDHVLKVGLYINLWGKLIACFLSLHIEYLIYTLLQNVTSSEKVQGPHIETCPASSRDACYSFNVKTEEVSDLEEEEYLAPVPFLGIKAEPEVSCVSVYVPLFTNTSSAMSEGK
jgi:hypothetical protein